MTEKNNFSFFQNSKCEFFPCHNTDNEEDFNCLFCYCPLYVLGDKCGGNPVFLEDGKKDCSRCLLPHSRESYKLIAERFDDICEIMIKNTVAFK